MADTTRFERPVTVLVGLGFPRSIESALEAYTLLQDWPTCSPARTVALNACRAAISGDVDGETARAALVAFADRQGILLANSGTPQMFARRGRVRTLHYASSSFAARQSP